jgi:gluconolactonase
LAFDTAGNLYLACYEPSQVLRVAPDGTVKCLIRDEEAHLI